MRKTLLIITAVMLVLGLAWGQDCTADDGTDGVELWGECYSIENTTELDLSYIGVTGEIPSEIGNLINLSSLILKENQLSGEIPPEISYLTNLTQLDLGGNQLSGEIPPEIGSLTNLNILDLAGNQLTGALPAEIGNLANLTELELGGNQLTGSIPPGIGNLSSLTFIHLEYNQFTGEIPYEIGNLTNLDWLNFVHNQLTGEIPSSICNLDMNWSDPNNFNISENQLCPPYPDCIEENVGEQDTTNCSSCEEGEVELWDECYSIENTTSLDLYANGLTGVIPPAIGNLVNLEGLYLASNQLSGEIPSEIGNLVNLNDLYLSYNQLSGEIPSEIGNLVNLIDFYLSSNQLSGEIPESICNIYPNLSYFQVTHNQLCPPYPECIEDYVGYQDTSNCEQVSIYDETLPITYNLYNAYPNPFNPMITIRYDVPKDELVNITIYDIMGRIIKTMVNTEITAGYKSIIWNATNDRGSPVSAGIYLYMIQAGEFRQTKKMVLLK